MTAAADRTTTQDAGNPDVHAYRVASDDWPAITDELNEYGAALLPQLLTDEEAKRIRDLYNDDGLFRSTGQRFTLALVFHDAA